MNDDSPDLFAAATGLNTVLLSLIDSPSRLQIIIAIEDLAVDAPQKTRLLLQLHNTFKILGVDVWDNLIYPAICRINAGEDK